VPPPRGLALLFGGFVKLQILVRQPLTSLLFSLAQNGESDSGGNFSFVLVGA